MVQVLEDNSPQSQRMAALSKLLGGLGNAGQSIKGSMDERSTRNALADRFGKEFKDIKDPNVRQQVLQGALQKESEEAKRKAQIAELQRSYPILEKRFGKEAADLIVNLGAGAQTDVIHNLLKEEARNKGFENQFGEENIDEDSDLLFGENEPHSLPSKNNKRINFDKGLTPDELVKRQESRYKTNLPLYTESATRLQSAEDEKEDLAILNDLSPRISGLERLNINPKTGDLIIPAAASEDAQRYVKTVNNFTRNAKQTYGSRITNFDLQQFLKRLPTLANSEGGRRQIIEQMEIINAINLAHDKTLHDVFEEYGGIRNIDYDRAKTLAEKRSKKQIDSLKSKFKDIGIKIDKEEIAEVKKFKSTVPKGRVAVRMEDGSLGDIPQENLSKFLKVPGNEVL